MQSLRQPAYIGENRCLPCTAVNLFIAVLVSLLLASLSFFLGAAALALFLVLIYFRGYLVPGTPELTARYLPNGVLRLFGKESESRGTTGEFEQLSAINIVVPCESSPESTCLTPEFRNAWREANRIHRSGTNRSA